MATAVAPILQAIFEAGICTTAGFLSISGKDYYVQKGESKETVEEHAKNGEDDVIPCCCGKWVKRSEFRRHFIFKEGRKEAEEAARHYENANGAELHYHNTTDPFPHFHPTRNGVKIHGGTHFLFPYGK